jgi:hypothetical protein
MSEGWCVATGALGEPRILAVVDGVVWLAFRLDDANARMALAFDLHSGRTLARCELPYPVVDHDVVADGYVLQRRNDVLTAFSLRTRTIAFSAPFSGAHLRAVHNGKLLLLAAMESPMKLVVADVHTGALWGALPLDGLPDGTLRAGPGERVDLAASQDRAILVGQNGILVVDLVTGVRALVMACTAGRLVGVFGHIASVLADCELVCIDLTAACVLWRRPWSYSAVVAPNGQMFVSQLDALCRLEPATGSMLWSRKITRAMGEISGIYIMRRGVYLLGSKGEDQVASGFERETGTPFPRHILPSTASYLIRGQEFPRVLLGNGVAVYEPDTPEHRVRIAIPAGYFVAGICAEGRLLLAGRDLIGIDMSTLPAQGDIGLQLSRVASSDSLAEAPAVVSLTSPVVMLRHPRYGRIRVTGEKPSPPARVGDSVIPQDVAVHRGGTVTASSWLRPSDTRATCETFPSAAMPPRMFDPEFNWFPEE